jgi:hypothetical protein
MLCGLCVATAAFAQPGPVLIWVTNSSVKLEQIIGDVDWEARAQGSNLLTVSQTVKRFHILGNGLGYSFEDKGRLIFLFGDTISESTSNWNYHAADPLAWSTNTDGETGLLLNFFTNNPITNALSQFTPIFVQPSGINMDIDAVPNSGISLSNGLFLVCNTGSDARTDTNNPHLGDYSVLVSVNETNLNALDPPDAASIFRTNRVISMLHTNLAPTNVLQGHFILTSLHEYGTNVLMFGTGEYRASDVYLAMTPAASFLSGAGTLYFSGLTNGQPTWSGAESNCVPVVQDNPTNGPPWPNDSPQAGNVSVIYSTNLNLWLMTYDGGVTPNTSGIYFSCASAPWGPWSTPQLIFNKKRDCGLGVFIHNASTNVPNDGLDGPVIGQNDPTNTAGGDFAPILIERFTRITNSSLFIYYTLSTWNPYTVVKMRSRLTIVPVIDPRSLVHKKNRFSFAWNAPTNMSYQVDYSSNLLNGWTMFPDVVTSASGTFNFTNIEPGGLPPARFYRLRTAP